MCGAIVAAGGSYTLLYGLASQVYSTTYSDAGGALAVLSFLALAVAMSVGGGALLSMALGASTWRRSTVISAAAHAIGVPLWIAIDFHLPSHNYYEGLAAYPAATYAIVVPFIMLFSTFRRAAPRGLAMTLLLAIGRSPYP